ncbi:hypothetical protein TCAL_15000 [Tigriopus californicus]|uniref:Uncharacterized protein n=1 Tax=Tigriopus californicus TaxID=6832 RepID=A0A553N7J8_TIGCA|nr:uncharacterized protein LOC131885372 [Tigriopus californicus]TRY61418.1 hypothetical protein TCAL_15000 [Tigriopus californicus]
MASKDTICVSVLICLAFVWPRLQVSAGPISQAEINPLMGMEDVEDGDLALIAAPRVIPKRSIEFMGMSVSYSQYVRLRNIQREVIRMDKVIRKMARSHDPVELAQNPHWLELLELYDALKKMLPEDYVNSNGGEGAMGMTSSRRSS